MSSSSTVARTTSSSSARATLGRTGRLVATSTPSHVMIDAVGRRHDGVEQAVAELGPPVALADAWAPGQQVVAVEGGRSHAVGVDAEQAHDTRRHVAERDQTGEQHVAGPCAQSPSRRPERTVEDGRDLADVEGDVGDGARRPSPARGASSIAPATDASCHASSGGTEQVASSTAVRRAVHSSMRWRPASRLRARRRRPTNSASRPALRMSSAAMSSKGCTPPG